MLENKENLLSKYQNDCGSFTNDGYKSIEIICPLFQRADKLLQPMSGSVWQGACEAPLVPITDFLLNMQSYKNLICASLTTSLLLPHFSI